MCPQQAMLALTRPLSIHQTVLYRPALDKEEEALPIAATCILVGSGSCVGYATLAAMVAAYQGAQAKLFEDKDISIGTALGFRLNGKKVEHEICIAICKILDDQFLIIHDPSANINTPILVEHAQYRGTFSAYHVFLNHGNFPEKYSFLESNMACIEEITPHLKEASSFVEEISHSDEFRSELESLENSIEEAKPDGCYSLTNSHDDYYFLGEELSVAKPSTKGLLERRPSLVSASKNPLIISAKELA